MKKIFTLIATTLMVMGANAQSISWTADDVANGLDGKTYGTGLVLTCTDTGSKMAVDPNPAAFGASADDYVAFSYRLKTGAKSTSKEALALTIPSAGTLNVYARTGSNSATNRTLTLTQNSTELYNKVVQEADATDLTTPIAVGSQELKKLYPVISVPVEAGTVDITFTNGSINFYGFTLVTATGVSNVEVAEPIAADGVEYNVAGAPAKSGAKGVVIVNGKKVVK